MAFYTDHHKGNIEVKSTAPNGVTFNVKGKSTHESATSGSVPYSRMSNVAAETDTRTIA